jgi:hypothetical protein
MSSVYFYTFRGDGFKFDPHPISSMVEMKGTQIRHIFLKINTKHLDTAKDQI